MFNNRNRHNANVISSIRAHARSATAVPEAKLFRLGRVGAHLTLLERLTGIFLLFMLVVWLSVGSTFSGFFDSAVSPGNLFTAGTWDDTQTQIVSIDAPLVLSLSTPEDFTVSGDDTSSTTPDDTPPSDPPADPAVEGTSTVEVSDPVTVITDATATDATSSDATSTPESQ